MKQKGNTGKHVKPSREKREQPELNPNNTFPFPRNLTHYHFWFLWDFFTPFLFS